MKLHFRLPNTQWCFVLWFRNGRMNETHIKTPANNSRLVDVMLTNKVGASEIRAIKSDPDSGRQNPMDFNPEHLQHAMTRLP